LVYCLFLLAIPFVLLSLPKDYFDQGQTVCVSVALFNQECYGCGMTRGIQHLLHLDFMSAASFNRMSFIVLPILIYLWIKELNRVLRLSKYGSPDKRE
jgi:hypothetical protein